MTDHTRRADQQIQELGQRWAAAEPQGDAHALGELLVDDFRAVGPLGFVLTKQQWLDRYGAGGLQNASFTFDDVGVRVYGDATIAIGTQTQTGSFRELSTDGTFRVTQTVILERGRWLIASIHLRPIASGGQPASIRHAAEKEST
jgi:ketosteroid isomerase-like protein